MRQPLQLAWVIAIAVVFGDGLARAQSSTNDFVSVVQEARAYVQRLHEIHDAAVKLQEKIPADQAAAIECIYAHVVKIEGLLQLTEDAQKDIQQAFKAGQTEAVKGYAGDVKVCYARAEKLLAEAVDCAAGVVLRTAPPTATGAAVTNAGVNIQIRPRAPRPLVARSPVARTDQTCLRHEQFASMLARAMDLKLDEKATPAEFIKALTRRAVEPLGGWQPGRCVTVDDVYVACARAMNLKAKDPKDPLSYGQALRDEGLAVDTLLPERDPQLDSPYVLDAEVRALLTTGYAAPLPSAKRVRPD